MKEKNDYIVKQFKPYLDGLEDSPLKTYIEERVIDQIVWYDQKSSEKQTRFKQLTTHFLLPLMLLFLLLYCLQTIVLLLKFWLQH